MLGIIIFALGALAIAWPAVLAIDLYLTFAHCERMRRGKWDAYLRRKFGDLGPAWVCGSVWIGTLGMWFATHQRAMLGLFWLFVLVSDIVNFITGEEKPPRWRKKALELLKKLEIKPAPKPAIELGRSA